MVFLILLYGNSFLFSWAVRKFYEIESRDFQKLYRRKIFSQVVMIKKLWYYVQVASE